MPKSVVQILFNSKMCEREIERNRKQDGERETETQRDRNKAEGIYHP